MSQHTIATCNRCPWEAHGADADRLANLHTTSKAANAARHATNTRSHPRHLCTDECQPRRKP